MNEFDEFEDMMKNLGINESEDEDSSSSLGDASDLDAQLNALLQADQDADDDFEHMEVGPLVSSRSIYDSGGIIDDGDGGALIYGKSDDTVFKGKKKKKKGERSLFAGLTVKRLLVASFIILFIAVGIGAGIFYISIAVAEQRVVVAAMSHFIPISMPQGNVANNANFIQINERITVGEQDMTLSHISAGYSGTYFYFSESFDPQEYIILLYDQARRLYVRQQFDLRHDPVLGTVMRFDPLLYDVSFLTLHIQNIETGEYGEFNYRLIGGITFGAPLFVNQPMSLLSEEAAQNGLRISHAEFNNVESAIFYTFSGDFSGVGLRQREGSEGLFMQMRDNFGGLTILTQQQAAVQFPALDTTIGRATFGPLLSLSSQIDLIFRDLYYVYPNPNIDIPLRHLSGRNQDDPHVIQVGAFNLKLEAMARQGNMLVLVLHSTNELGARVSTHLDASLYIDLGRGQSLTIPADIVNTAPLGTDVVFNLNPHVAALNNVHIDHYTLLFHYVEFGVPETIVTIDMARTAQQPSSRRETAVLAVEAAFMSRLAYMSGEIALNNIVGFAPELLRDEEIMEFFAPRSRYERPMYGVTVVAGDFYDNYTFLAVVESEWAVGQGESLQFIRTTHQVIARSHEGIWSVVSDKRI
jgi:hypothetical protein